MSPWTLCSDFRNSLRYGATKQSELSLHAFLVSAFVADFAVFDGVAVVVVAGWRHSCQSFMPAI